MTTSSAVNQLTAVPASLFRQLVLSDDGSPVVENDDSDGWSEMDALESELVAVGTGSLLITSTVNDALAHAVGAVDESGKALPTFKARFKPGLDGQHPIMADLLVVKLDGEVSLVFRVTLTYQDLHAATDFDLGSSAMMNSELEKLEPGDIVLALGA
ncbi:MAG: hypothetical protein H7293_04125 [Candidatus Saccharibacteria bacterium]|nr:hypothetical protein [Rhodoferax sp.]